MWPQSGGQLSPPMIPSLIQESQRGSVQARPSNSQSHQSLILEPLHLSQTEVVGSGVIYRCACKCVEEPIAFRESDYSENVKKKGTEVSVSPERVERDYAMESNFRPGRAVRMPSMPRPNALTLYVASKVIKHARDINYTNAHMMWCPDCHLFPTLPVTGTCGHTRCTKCIEKNRACPCGTLAPATLHTSIFIQDLMSKMLPSAMPISAPCCCSKESSEPDLSQMPSTSKGPDSTQRQCRLLHCGLQPTVSENAVAVQTRQPITLEARYTLARELLAFGRYKEAAAHLAHIAASSGTMAWTAKRLLAQAISALSGSGNPHRISREIYRSVREHSAFSWLKPSDLECIICYHVLRRPVTTPCGHTFCRACIERVLDYRKRCPLCSHSLDSFNVELIADTTFVAAALAAIRTFIPSASPESEYIPIFACTVAFPAVPCPLLIFDPRYWAMINLVLESGSRKFGMVTFSGNTYSSYGTVVEVRDCVQFEDRRSILSTVGISRFQILERVYRNGCHMARIQNLTDIKPDSYPMVWDLQMLAQNVACKALMWLFSLDRVLVSDIESAFGDIPPFELDDDWWKSPDGPKWLWWLIAILPLKPEIQLLMLSTDHLTKRMMAVSRTLDVMLQVSVTPVLRNCMFESDKYIYYQCNRNGYQ